MFLRRHWIVFWRKVILFFVIAVMPPVIWAVISSQTEILEDPQNTFRIILIFGSSIFYLFWLRQLFTMWIDYYLDVWICTNERIMNIEHSGLFHRKVSEQRLDRIQDVTTESRGFLQTTMNFGDIHVQTAAETEHFVFRDIANPEEVAREISQLQDMAIKASTPKKETEPVTPPQEPQKTSTPPRQSS